MHRVRSFATFPPGQFGDLLARLDPETLPYQYDFPAASPKRRSLMPVRLGFTNAEAAVRCCCCGSGKLAGVRQTFRHPKSFRYTYYWAMRFFCFTAADRLARACVFDVGQDYA
jgi:hypothetical protein